MTRIELLTQKLLDDAISDEEVAELEGLVARGESGVNEHFLLLDIEAALRGLARGPDLRQPVLERLRAERTARMQQAVLHDISARPAPDWQRRPRPSAQAFPRSRIVGVLAAVAAVVVLAVGLSLALRGSGAGEADQRVRVVSLHGRLEVLTAGGESQLAHVGQEITPGQTLRTADEESFAVVEFADQTRLDLSPESIVRLVGGAGKRVLLASGALRASVLPQPRDTSLVIATPVAEVHVAGAATLLSATVPDSTRIDMENGRAVVVRQADGRQVGVEAGSSATVRADLEDMIVKPHGQLLSQPRWRLGFFHAHTLAFTPNGSSLLAANSLKLFRYSLPAEEERVQPMPVRVPAGTRAFLARDGGSFILASRDELTLWDAAELRRRLAVGVGSPTPYRPVAVAADGRWLAAQDPDRPSWVLFWDVSSGRLRASWEADGFVRNLAFSADGSVLVVGTKESLQAPTQRIQLWDTTTLAHQATMITDLPASWEVVLAPDGQRLATLARDHRIQIWHVPTRSLERVIDARERLVRCLAFAPDSRVLAGGTKGGSVLLWDLETGEERLEMKGEQRGVQALAFAPDGKTLASCSLHGPILLWELP